MTNQNNNKINTNKINTNQKTKSQTKPQTKQQTIPQTKIQTQKIIAENFDAVTSEISSGYEDLINIISVSPSAGNKISVTLTDQFNDYVILFLKYGFFVGILTLNFLGLSVSLNCNTDQELMTRIFSAIFAFFFGVVYLLINYYTFKVLSQGKMCKMNRDKLFPFKT